MRLFEYQLRYNEPYARYSARLGFTAAPASWDRIPAVPAPAFRDAALTTFVPQTAALIFQTSGTTTGMPGRHYMESAALYDSALLAAFDRFALADGARLRYFNLVPNPADNPHSSLGYMMWRIAELRGDARTGWYLSGDTLRFDDFVADVQGAIAQVQAVCIAATAFALVHLLDSMERCGLTLGLPNGSRLIETGGFKGRARVVNRDELYARIGDAFQIAGEAIVSEYSMTELASQYYTCGARRRFVSPPWLRVRVVGPQRTTLPMGETGSLLHVDLANRSSCIAIQTEDLGLMDEEGLVLLGRDREAQLRGCSLEAEDLRLRERQFHG